MGLACLQVLRGLLSHSRAELAWRMFLSGGVNLAELRGEAEEHQATELVHAPSAMVLWAE